MAKWFGEKVGKLKRGWNMLYLKKSKSDVLIRNGSQSQCVYFKHEKLAGLIFI